MKRLLALLLALFSAVCAYAQGSTTGTPPKQCTWGLQGNMTYLTPTAACMGIIGQPAYKDWTFVEAVKEKDIPGVNGQRYSCVGTHKAFGNDPQMYAIVYTTCTEADEKACKAFKDVKRLRIFDWLKERGDEYDIYKAPAKISINGCEYKRVNEIKIADQRKQCKYPVTVSYVGTGETRADPLFEDVKEKCTGDEEEPGGEDDVTPGNFPAIRDLYEPEYPNGLTGVINDIVGKLKQTPFFGLITKLTAPFSMVGGVCDAYGFDFNFGAFLNMGNHQLVIDCKLFTALKAIVLLTALIAARRIIFGG